MAAWATNRGLPRTWAPPMRQVHVGAVPILSDILNAINDFINNVPGGEWIKGAYNTLDNSFIGDMVKSPEGQIALVSITTAMSTGLSNVVVPLDGPSQVKVGPIIASAVWAVPGVVSGDSFQEAYAKSLSYRIMQLDKIGGGPGLAAEFSGQVKDLLNNPDLVKILTQLKSLYGDETAQQLQNRLNGLADPDTIVSRYGKRGDAGAAVANGVFRKPIWDLISQFGADGTLLHPHALPTLPGNIPSQGPIPSGMTLPRGRPVPPTPVKMPGGTQTIFMTSMDGGALSQILIFAGLTSPFWFPVFVLPHLSQIHLPWGRR